MFLKDNASVTGRRRAMADVMFGKRNNGLNPRQSRLSDPLISHESRDFVDEGCFISTCRG